MASYHTPSGYPVAVCPFCFDPFPEPEAVVVTRVLYQLVRFSLAPTFLSGTPHSQGPIATSQLPGLKALKGSVRGHGSIGPPKHIMQHAKKSARYKPARVIAVSIWLMERATSPCCLASDFGSIYTAALSVKLRRNQTTPPVLER